MPASAVTVTATFKAEQGEEPSTFDPEAFDFWAYTGDDDHPDPQLGADWEKTENSVKVSATNPDGTDWHIKLAAEIDDIKAGHYYEVTYAINSNVAGEVLFETNTVADYALYTQRVATLAPGENTVKYTFRASGAVEGSIAILQLGALPANFEVEITSFEYEEKTNVGNYADGWWLDNGGSATADDDYSTGALVVTATGTGVGYELKLAKDVTLKEGHQYELTFIYSVSGGKQGNAKFVVYNNEAGDAVTNIDYGDQYGDRNGFCWYNPQYDENKVFKKTIKFTAEEGITIGSCLEYGEWSDSTHSVTVTVYYVNFADVTPPPATPAE